MNSRIDPNLAAIISGKGSLPAVRVTAPEAGGEIYLHGGHVTSWTPRGSSDVLWCSAKSWWQHEKPIRGGVPVCFPWFGAKADDPAAPAHGFARLVPWNLESITPSAGGVAVTVALVSGDATRKFWPHDFILRHRVSFGAELVMQLELTNTGKAELTAQEAQHTYFAVGDIRQVTVRGLAGVTYRSKVENVSAKAQEKDITFDSETDRLFLNTESPLTIDDASLERRITIIKENSKNTVVWNPWIAKARAMPDFGDDEWTSMLCVETANVAELAVKLAPGQSHTMTTRLKVQAL